MSKDRRATDLLNIALAGAESAVRIAEGFAERDECKTALAKAHKYLEEAREHLLTVQFHSIKI